jgi:transposase-like protein
MPQLQLPLFEDGIHLINANLGYRKENEQITYLQGMMPVFVHDLSDTASFQMIVSQFYLNGNAKQVEIVKAFGIHALALKRWVKKYREGGPRAFYIEKRGRPRSKKKVFVAPQTHHRRENTVAGSSEEKNLPPAQGTNGAVKMPPRQWAWEPPMPGCVSWRR